MAIGMQLAGKATKRAADFGGVCIARNAEKRVCARIARARRGALACATATTEKFARLQRTIAESFTRWSHGNAEADARVVE